MAALYVTAGLFHFINPKFYLKITPKWVPFPGLMNVFIGVIEIILGLALLFSTTRYYAAIGIVLLLIAVFPANVYHFQKAKRKQKLVLVTLLRLPIQVLLIYWAYTFV
jgi:uncharacterized membrane protein